ncbi:unnamed protein product [Clonostachys solani]|uniref:Gelsolin repeat protein n=1 Tax=Clonostachys solani TaxID=160281 RepID=A0A9N9Z4Q4_9HYPO|nr:unnamed protein product [Clonostachys solani]
MSDEVSQFLEQVERLRGQQADEDEARAREHEEYLAAKRERQARREERARSISPQKSSPANTPSPRSSRQIARLPEGSKLDSPTSKPAHTPHEQFSEPEAKSPPPMDFPSSTSPTKENEGPGSFETEKPASEQKPSNRGSGLSWQKRPASRNGPGGPRPLSMVATQNATQKSLVGSPVSPEAQSATETSFSREQIAQSLGSKDPTWFRQTADRGLNSAAYRKNQVEDDERADPSSVKAQLPGMYAEPAKESVSDASSPIRRSIASPPTLNPPRFDKPAEGSSSPTNHTRSPSGSPTRSTSPTKGMGGFVQSAMMKRSDSVKRWSVQSPPGLARGNTLASNRSGHGKDASISSSKPPTLARDNSATPSSSVPASPHDENDNSNDTTPRPSGTDTTMESKPDLGEGQDQPIPVSPSRTMDPRRWSPTKGSWLESALNKPESPKPQQKPNNSTQPAWMAELNKNKNERAGPGHKHQVSIGGLMRSTPMGDAAKPNTTGLGGIYSPPPGGNRPAFGHRPQPSISKPVVEPSASKDEVDEVDNSETAEVEQQAVGNTDSKQATTPSSLTSPPQLKPKPETPPKKDFRTNLRQRPAQEGPKGTDELEFRRAFGSLRRAKTQNYVAPDELKSNILRGKAALNLTGGPQKSEIKDEFKEAILKKKGDFKKAQQEGKGITRTSSLDSEQPVPEGLARRAELGRPPIGLKKDPVPVPSRSPTIGVTDPKSPPASIPLGSSSPELKQSPTETEVKKETPVPLKVQGRVGGSKLANRFNPALAGMLARGPPPMAADGGNASRESGRETQGAAEPTKPGPQLTHMTKGRARGPKRKAPSTAASSQNAPASAPSADIVTRPSKIDVPPAAFSPMSPDREEPSSSKLEGFEVNDTTSPVSPPPLSIQQQVAAKASLRGKISPPELRNTALPSKPVAVDTVQSPPFRRQPASPEKETARPLSPLKPHKTGGDVSQPGSPRKLDAKRMSKFLDDSSLSSPKPETARDTWKLGHQRTGSRSPVKSFEAPSSPVKRDEPPISPLKRDAALFSPVRRDEAPNSPAKREGFPSPPMKKEETPRLRNESSFKSIGQETPSSLAKREGLPSPQLKREEMPRLRNESSFKPAGQVAPLKLASRNAPEARTSPSPRPKPLGFSPASPESSVRSARPLPNPPSRLVSPTKVPTPLPSPSKQTTEVSLLLTDFFGPNRPSADCQVDATSVITHRPEVGAKVDTLGARMFQITGDGKKRPVDPQFGRTLFEREMYIVAHDFRDGSGRPTSETYFWAGDEVPESTIEDAQLFAAREARSLGGKLVKLRQGKESIRFLSALGDVIITRRGSSGKFDSLAPCMLCGRRYMGEVVFDEVDFALASLCAGFPFVVSSGGNCYVWQGKGSTVDEVSCAKLVGMEITITGDLTALEEGSEPESFWKMFEAGTKPHSADHWRLKPNYDKYSARLFCSDAESRQQIFEISPFSQSDLSPFSIYVLDAFFEMYVIVGSKAQSQFTSFRNGLSFAQDYAILAASIEDRPFIPVSTVVLEGVPRDLKRVFRKWEDEKSPTVMIQPPAAGLRRGRSLRVVSLTQALLALQQ